MTDSQDVGSLFRSSFRYLPLDKCDSIRLLHLHPASSRQAEVKCSLIQTTLQSCGDIYEHYIAISYVWGNTEDVRTIYVNEFPLLITTNLFSALQDLRDETRDLMIWADAICINQHDNMEKMKQIAMMGEIYSMAAQTVIYLGCLDTQTELKLDGWASTNFEESQFPTEMAHLILSSPWFRRVWVFQELVFSKDPRVQFGRYRFPWSHLYRVVNRQIGSTNLEPNMEGLPQSFKLLSEMHQARERHLTEERQRCEAWASATIQSIAENRSGLMMIDLLRARRGLGVTNPKDMIFAHLGFASDASDITPRINYSMDHTVLYNAFACYTIDQGLHCELFDAISDADLSTTPKGLSSWSPDWSIAQNYLCSPKPNWWDHGCYSLSSNTLFFQDSFFFENPDSMKAKKRSLGRENMRKDVYHTFVDYPPILACLGAEVDTVVGCSGSLSNLVELYLHNSNIGECCWRNAFTTLTYQTKAFGAGPGCRGYSHLANIQTIEVILESLMGGGFTLDYLPVKSRDLDYAFRTMVGAVGTTISSHCILTLMKSGNLALVPKLTQPGDIIAAFLLPSSTNQANTFLVLRPIAAKEHDLEVSLTKIFRQRIRPILHCTIMGHYRVCTNASFVIRDQPTPEYKYKEELFKNSFCDTPWKGIMAGSGVGVPSVLDSIGNVGVRKITITWKTFAIH